MDAANVHHSSGGTDLSYRPVTGKLVLGIFHCHICEKTSEILGVFESVLAGVTALITLPIRQSLFAILFGKSAASKCAYLD